MKASRI
jgi:hypothetical protein